LPLGKFPYPAAVVKAMIILLGLKKYELHTIKKAS